VRDNLEFDPRQKSEREIANLTPRPTPKTTPTLDHPATSLGPGERNRAAPLEEFPQKTESSDEKLLATAWRH
jgi:hypothetical protein